MCQNRKLLPLGEDGRVLRTHIRSWFIVYKEMLVGISHASYYDPDLMADRSGWSTRSL